MSKLTEYKKSLLENGKPIPCIKCGVIPTLEKTGLCHVCDPPKILCKNCGEPIFYSDSKQENILHEKTEPLGWIHFHKPHNELTSRCKVCDCVKAEPKVLK